MTAKEKINSLYQQKIPFLFIIDFEQKTPRVYRLDELPSDIEYSIPTSKTNSTDDVTIKNYSVYLERYPITREKYEIGFNKAMQHIQYGNSFLLNYTCSTPIISNADLRDIYAMSNAPYRLRYKNQFVVSSPESFIKIRGDQISTYPMKGTIDANIPDAEKIIMSDDKELAEHFTIVDLLRNDLSIVAQGVDVERFRYIDRIRSNEGDLLQVSSKITGTIRNKYKNHLGDLLYALLPAGSVSGAPKRKTTQIIREIENEDRGYYTGIFGVFDGNQLDSAVMIRFIESKNGELFYRSGGGITHLSTVEQEYQEMVQKVYLPTDMKRCQMDQSTTKPLSR